MEMETSGSADSESPSRLENLDSQDKEKKKFRRNRVACDACHTRRVRCDGSFPCSRCVGSRIHCELTRERRKRGRIARKKTIDNVNSTISMTTSAAEVQQSGMTPPSRPPQNPSSVALPSLHTYSSPSAANEPVHHNPAPVRDRYSISERRPSPREILGATVSEELPPMSNGFRTPYSYDLLRNQSFPDGPTNAPPDITGNSNGMEYESSRGRASQPMGSEVPLKYPVLQPLMPCLDPHLPRALVYDLFELYFTSAFSTSMHPACHHIHCYVVRKASLLSQENPRKTSPALLASMLWVAALDDRAFALSISPTKRRKICQFLCALTIRLLRPLIHVSFRGEDSIEGLNEYPSPTAIHEPTANRTHSFEEGGDDRGLVGPAGSLDDIITYIHVASIISASEQKAASMRWWHAAFTLARELKLNQEVEAPPTVDNAYESAARLFDFPGSTSVPAMPIGDTVDYSGPVRHSLNCLCDRPQHRQDVLTEEHREERRRTWWLLYIMDRHLALCYNRPLALLDAECEDLLLPLEEGPWQAGDVHSNSPKPDGPRCLISGAKHKRRTFPDFTCHDHSIFGFFLPLMTITGELINLNLAKNHPMLGTRLEGKNHWASQTKEVFQQLDVYRSTLATFAASSTSNTVTQPPDVMPYRPDPLLPSPSAISPPILPPPSPTANLSTYHSWHTQTVVAYASYLVHVLHILLTGKWDPVSLLEDKDFWTSSPTFASTISHALEAASALEQILHYDPDVSFMPYFFGIQLLQGSILLLLIVERLQNEAGEGILKACEVVIRATESCVVTLNTEYQRMFRQVMRSAVAQARGRPVNHSEIRHRRKAVLALYRWTRNGTGLAL